MQRFGIKFVLAAGISLFSATVLAEPMPPVGPFLSMSEYQLPADATNIRITHLSSKRIDSGPVANTAPGGPESEEIGDRVTNEYERGGFRYREVWEFSRTNQDNSGRWVRVEYSERAIPEGSQGGVSGGNGGSTK